ncbi:ABC transporter permease subunit [Rossellomorea arthrocnemi]|uniref:ABC transporter permease subunit n=1 Tax=Rossellomorea arthrocnemi TaxID=2769542 RepID=UPI001919CD62|nr:ABC transporter permease subunit [Rossellomorea arthrocnemi]
MKKIKQSGLEAVLIIIGILLVSATSGLFKNQAFSLITYTEELVALCKEIVEPHKLVYTNPISDIERPLFPIILKAFLSSARIFFLSLGLALSSSLLLMILYFSVGKTMRKCIQGVSFYLASLPDIFIIGILQVVVIWFFKQTGILLVDVASLGKNQVILFPAITLSILPTFFFLGSMVSFLQEEEGLPYVELAKGKGLGKFRVMFIHMMRNVLVSLTYHGKQIIWMMLSNLLILEYLFNVFGVTSFLFSYNTPAIFAITSIMLFVPLYFLLKVMQFVISRKIGREMSL